MACSRLMRRPHLSWLVLSLLVAGCPGGMEARDGGTSDGSPGHDGGPIDAPEDDAGSGDGGTGDGGGGGDAPDGGGPSSCPPPPACDAPLPDLGPTADWRHGVATPITVLMGSARHRGRDLILGASDPQWVLGKFAYGLADDDLKDEDVDLWLDRGCTGTWELLGTATTTNDGDHTVVEDVEDTGGRVYFEIPTASRLELGRHRVVMVVRGDHSLATQYIDVLPSGTRVVVTDIDGTQTESETAEYGALLTGSGPAARPHGAELLTELSAHGFHVFYLTARPDWLHTRTHEWLAENGYPAGTVHTTLNGLGATGSAAISFKTAELAWLERHAPGSLDWAIGNTDTDVAAYVNSGVPPERLFAYQYDPGAEGTRVDDYATLLPEAEGEPVVCH